MHFQHEHHGVSYNFHSVFSVFSVHNWYKWITDTCWAFALHQLLEQLKG